jgi:hypothetical protein
MDFQEELLHVQLFNANVLVVTHILLFPTILFLWTLVHVTENIWIEYWE